MRLLKLDLAKLSANLVSRFSFGARFIATQINNEEVCEVEELLCEDREVNNIEECHRARTNTYYITLAS